jgi:hypothetical protein
MEESLSKLAETLGADEELFLKIINKDTIKDMHECLCSASGEDYSFEVFEMFLIQIIRRLILWRQLPKKELEGVAGGGKIFQITKDIWNSSPVGSVKEGMGVGRMMKDLINGMIGPFV